MVFRICVTFVNGDDFNQVFESEIDIDAENETNATLIANQMISTPAIGKPDHIQIIRTEIVSVLI